MHEKMRISKFEELVAWQKARGLTKEIYLNTRDNTFAKDYGLAGQIQRASVSIMSNIAEGFDTATTKEFSRYLNTALASCSEVRSHLYVAFDVGYVTETTFKDLRSKATEVSRIIAGLRIALKKKLSRRPLATSH
jgi:four helix bundle protein